MDIHPRRRINIVRIYTFIPPSLAHTQIFAVRTLGYYAVLFVTLRDDVVGLDGAFFDEFFADAVGDVGFCDGGGAFAEFGGELDGCGDSFSGLRIGFG